MKNQKGIPKNKTYGHGDVIQDVQLTGQTLIID
jgi:hypothetical protein